MVVIKARDQNAAKVKPLAIASAVFGALALMLFFAPWFQQIPETEGPYLINATERIKLYELGDTTVGAFFGSLFLVDDREHSVDAIAITTKRWLEKPRGDCVGTNGCSLDGRWRKRMVNARLRADKLDDLEKGLLDNLEKGLLDNLEPTERDALNKALEADNDRAHKVLINKALRGVVDQVLKDKNDGAQQASLDEALQEQRLQKKWGKLKEELAPNPGLALRKVVEHVLLGQIDKKLREYAHEQPPLADEKGFTIFMPDPETFKHASKNEHDPGDNRRVFLLAGIHSVDPRSPVDETLMEHNREAIEGGVPMILAKAQELAKTKEFAGDKEFHLVFPVFGSGMAGGQKTRSLEKMLAAINRGILADNAPSDVSIAFFDGGGISSEWQIAIGCALARQPVYGKKKDGCENASSETWYFANWRIMAAQSLLVVMAVSLSAAVAAANPRLPVELTCGAILAQGFIYWAIVSGVMNLNALTLSHVAPRDPANLILGCLAAFIVPLFLWSRFGKPKDKPKATQA